MLSLPLTLTNRVLKPARLCTITRRDGPVVRFAEAQNSVTISGDTWVPHAGIVFSAIKHSANGDPGSMSIQGAASIGGTIALEDIDNGKYDDALVQVYMANRDDLSAKGLLFTGNVGPIAFSPITGKFSFDCRGLAVKAAAPFGQVFAPSCRTDLGSFLCKVPIRPDPDDTRFFANIARLTAYPLGYFVRVDVTGGSDPTKWADRYYEVTTAGTTAGSQPSFTTTPGGTTTDGSCTFTCRNAWVRAAKVATVDDQFTFTLDRDPDARAVDGWFNGGAVRMYDGYSTGAVIEVGKWVSSTKTITTYLPIFGALDAGIIAVGDWLEIWRGCHKRRPEDCFGVFANAKNFRGEDTITGISAVSAGEFGG